MTVVAVSASVLVGLLAAAHIVRIVNRYADARERRRREEVQPVSRADFDRVVAELAAVIRDRHTHPDQEHPS